MKFAKKTFTYTHTAYSNLIKFSKQLAKTWTLNYIHQINQFFILNSTYSSTEMAIGSFEKYPAMH